MEQLILHLFFFGTGIVIGGLVAVTPWRTRTALALLILPGSLLAALGALASRLGIFPDLLEILKMDSSAKYAWLFWPVLLLYNSLAALSFFGLVRGVRWTMRHLRDRPRRGE